MYATVFYHEGVAIAGKNVNPERRKKVRAKPVNIQYNQGGRVGFEITGIVKTATDWNKLNSEFLSIDSATKFKTISDYIYSL